MLGFSKFWERFSWKHANSCSSPVGTKEEAKWNWKGGTKWRQLEQTKISKKNNKEKKLGVGEREPVNLFSIGFFFCQTERKSIRHWVHCTHQLGIILVSGRLKEAKKNCKHATDLSIYSSIAMKFVFSLRLEAIHSV